MEIRNFLNDIEEKLKAWGVETIFSPEKQVYTLGDGKGLACSGFFSELPKPKLAVAMGKPEKEWVVILAHEFSHATQWIEQSDLWKELFSDFGQGREEASDALDRWLEGEEWSEAKIQDVIGRIRDVERDCEERTVHLLQKYNLLESAEEYTQKSNAYVYFYNHVAKTRKWYESGRAPYELPEVWMNAPKTFARSTETPTDLEAAFERIYSTKTNAPKFK